MRSLIRILTLSTLLTLVTLETGCVVEPIGYRYHCGYYHCR